MAAEYKRYTTPTMPIILRGITLDKLTEVKFAFKSKDDEQSPVLHEVGFVIKDIPPEKAKELFEEGEDYVIVNIPFEKEDTLKLPPGKIFVDILPICNDSLLRIKKKPSFTMHSTYFATKGA